MSITWTTTPADMMTALVTTWESRVYAAIVTVCHRREPEIENWMQDNAPWTDRTGNARQTLHVRVIPALHEVLVVMAHGMDYGIYLELANGGRYGIIAQTVDHWAPILMNDIRELLR